MNNNALQKQTVFDADSDLAAVDPMNLESVAAEKNMESAKTESGGMLQLFRKYASLADLLRYAGVVSVAVAMAMFLIDGAARFNDLQRFLTMLGFTAVLAVAGLLTSVLLKEQRGSRAFMMLSLLSVPVNFAVFGALFYSLYAIDSTVQNYPALAYWQAGYTDVITALVVGSAVIVPVVWMGYTILVRSARRWLSLGLLLSSAVLIVPVRDETIITGLAVLAVAALCWFVRRNSGDSLVMKTLEGRFSTALLFVPPFILIARGLVIYSASSVTLLMLSVGAYFLMRQLVSSRKQADFLTGFGVLMAAGLASLSSVATADVMGGLLGGRIGSELALIFGVCMFLLLNHDIFRCSPGGRLVKSVGLISVLASVLLLVSVSLGNSSGLLSVLSIAVLLATVVYGYRRGFIPIAVIALIGIAVVSSAHIEAMWSTALQTGWWGIAAVGAAAIVASSLLDRAGTVVVQKPESVPEAELEAEPEAG